MDTRPITAEELSAFHQNFRQTLGFPPPSEADLERDKRGWDFSRTLATFDDGLIVGTTHSHLFDLALPGGSSVAAAGVTAVATRTTHRRRGIVSELMRRQLAETIERGEPVAILVASEGAIYRRFGYGIGSWAIDVEIDPRETRGVGGPSSDGRIRVVDEATADDLFPEIHERARRATPGGIARPKYFWESITDDRKVGAETHIVYDSASGSADGYARYKIESKWEAGIPQHRLNVHEFVTCTNEASAALWRHLLSADLIRVVDIWNRPVDEPLRWWLANPRALRVKNVRDHLWVRPLDVPTLLGSRCYTTDIDTTLEVVDDFGGWAAGRYALSGGPTGAECSRTDRAADIELHVADLGSILLGGTSLMELAGAGLLVERTAGAVIAAEAAFRWSPQPWSNQYF